MNSWEIIKQELTKTSRPGTMGRHIDMNLCGDLFVRLRHKLNDQEEATKSMNQDDECRAALLQRRNIKELREAGIIQ